MLYEYTLKRNELHFWRGWLQICPHEVILSPHPLPHPYSYTGHHLHSGDKFSYFSHFYLNCFHVLYFDYVSPLLLGSHHVPTFPSSCYLSLSRKKSKKNLVKQKLPKQKAYLSILGFKIWVDEDDWSGLFLFMW